MNLCIFFCVWQNSLTRSAPLNSDSQGRFGNRFLSSYDHRFVIKTVSSEDIAEMHNILKKYHQVEAPCTAAAAQTDGIKTLSVSLSVLQYLQSHMHVNETCECGTDLTVEQRRVQFNQPSYSSLPHFLLTLLLLCSPPLTASSL